MYTGRLLALQAVTPPNTMQVSSFPAPMPTAAAVAAAAVTAKITAMDAIVSIPAMKTLFMFSSLPTQIFVDVFFLCEVRLRNS